MNPLLPLLLFVIIIATIAATAGFKSKSAHSTITTVASTNTTNGTTTLTALTSAYTHHHDGAAVAVTNFKTQHGRVTMVENETFFQIHLSEKSHLCMEIFKTLETVSRLWLRPCKSKGERGYERQMFGVTNDGKIHPSTKPSSCIFLYDKKNLKYRKDCDGIRHQKKNQFVFNFFDNTIFLLGDVTKVMTVLELQGIKEVKLQRETTSKSTKQHWTLRFERDRVLQSADDDFNDASCMPSGKLLHPSSPTSTQIPKTVILPARPPYMSHPPTTYQRITTRNDFNLYVYVWLKNNMKGVRASDPENELYHELVEKYG